MSPREKRDVVLKVFLGKDIPDWAHEELDNKFRNKNRHENRPKNSERKNQINNETKSNIKREENNTESNNKKRKRMFTFPFKFFKKSKFIHI